MKKDFTHALSTGLIMPSACKKAFLAHTLTVTENKVAVSPVSQQPGEGYTNWYSNLTSGYRSLTGIYNSYITTHFFTN